MINRRKIYCYVDETGQDTEGNLFIVSVIILEGRDKVLLYLSNLEVDSGKHRVKWGRSEQKKRLAYLVDIFNQKIFSLKTYYSVYQETKDYTLSTILTIARAIRMVEDYKEKQFTVLVDGLKEKEQRYYGSQLRQLGISSKKVRGIRKDENDALIRLADAVCGFVRDVIQGEKGEARKLYEKARKKKILIEV